jgi:hypothetical protein
MMKPTGVSGRGNKLPPEAAAKVLAGLPFHVAVHVLDEPEMEVEYEILTLLPPATAAQFVKDLRFRPRQRRPRGPALIGARDPTYGSTQLGWCLHGAQHCGNPNAGPPLRA